MADKDYLNSCYILSNWTDPTTKFPFYAKIKDGREIFLEHKFKKIHAPLLVAIDNDNVSLTRACLARYRISPNHKYVIPQCETSNPHCFYLEPLLHRAISAGSVDVFEEFLKQGADLKAKGYLDTDAIENVFDLTHRRQTKGLQLGKVLIRLGKLNQEDLARICAENRIPICVYTALNRYAEKLKQVKIKVRPLTVPKRTYFIGKGRYH